MVGQGLRSQKLLYPDFKHMMQRYRGNGVCHKPADTLFGSDDAVPSSSIGQFSNKPLSRPGLPRRRRPLSS